MTQSIRNVSLNWENTTTYIKPKSVDYATSTDVKLMFLTWKKLLLVVLLILTQ